MSANYVEEANLPQPSSMEELSQVLSMVIGGNNNEEIRMGTRILLKFLKTDTCVTPMLRVISDADHYYTRQIACVLLRRKLARHWSSSNDEVKAMVRDVLFTRLRVEEEQVVQLAVVGLIVQVARVAFSKDEWPGLLEAFAELFKSESVSLRACVVVFFGSLSHHLYKHMRPYFNSVYELFHAALHDSSETVVQEAMLQVPRLIKLVHEESQLRKFRELVPSVVRYITEALQHYDAASSSSEFIEAGFESLDELASCGVNVLTGHIKELAEIMIRISCNTQLEMKLRENAATFLVTIVQNKPGQITKNNLLGTVIDCVTTLATEPWDNPLNLEESSPQHCSVDVLDAVISALPRALLLEPLLTLVNELVSSQNALRRKGGMIMLATMGEGMAESLVPYLADLVPLVCRFVREDSSVIVRGVACMTLTQFADHIGEPMCEFHSEIMPTLMTAMSGDLGEVVALKGTITLSIMSEQLGEMLNEYLETILNTCYEFYCADSVPIKMKEAVVTVIKACAKGVAEDFVKYAPRFLGLAEQAMDFQDDQLLKLRAVWTECAGDIGQAVGWEHYGPYHKIFLEKVSMGMKLEFTELRECSFRFFICLIIIIGEGFCQDVELLTTIFDFCFASIRSVEGVEFKERRDPTAGPRILASGENTDFNGVEARVETDSDDDDGMPHSFMIVTGVMDEKVAAAACCATIVEIGGLNVYGVVGKMVEALDDLADYMHPILRAAACSAMQEMVTWFSRYSDQVDQKATMNFLRVVSDSIVPRQCEEESKEVVATANDCVTEILKNFGAEPFQDNNKLEAMCESTVALLCGQHYCQESTEDVDEKVIKDHDSKLMDSVTAIVPALCKALGSGIEDVFDSIVPALDPFADPERDAHDKGFAPGIYAECIPWIKEVMPKYIGPVLNVCMRMIDEPEMVVRNNVIFCLGTLCLYVPELVQDDNLDRIYSTFTKQALADPSSFGHDPTGSAHHVRDNATAGVAKMIITLHKRINVIEAIPIMLQGMPLRVDVEEAPFTFQALICVFENNLGDCKAYAEPAVCILSEVLGIHEAGLDEEMQAGIAGLAKHLAQTHADATQRALADMDEAHAQNFMAHIA